MKSFYEKHRDDKVELLLSRSRSHVYPAHFHINMEIFILLKGEYDLTINETHYHLSSGSIAVIDSYDIHSFDRKGKGLQDDCVLNIPFRSLARFQARRKGLRIADPIIKDAALCRQLLQLCDGYLDGSISRETEQAVLDLMLSLLFDNLKFAKAKAVDERELIRKILSYLQEHYRERITRTSLAHTLGYTEAHISRVFHRSMGRGITEYVNDLRLQYIESCREAGDKRGLSELIFEAGFQSQQTYYRVKKKQKESE